MTMIRQFHPEDASACSRILHDCLDENASYPPALLSRIRSGETPRSMTERAELFYIAVCEEEGRISGFAGLDLNEIRLMYVGPGSRRRGIGRLLLEHFKAMVPGGLFADIVVYSTVEAAGFYKSCGFSDRGPFVFDIDGIPLRTIFMTLPLIRD